MPNSPPPTSVESLCPKESLPQKISKPPSLEISIGSQRVESLQSRTKDNVVHAGLSQPSELWNPSSRLEETPSTCPNNSSLTAQDPKETKDAMVDGPHLLSTMSRPMVSQAEVNTPMSPETKPARSKVDLPELVDTPVLVDAMASLTPSTLLPFQSPSMPPTGADTPLEFSATAEPTSTTPFSWWVWPEETGRSRTLGEQDGESQDISDLPVETLAVFARWLVSSQTDLESH